MARFDLNLTDDDDSDEEELQLVRPKRREADQEVGTLPAVDQEGEQGDVKKDGTFGKHGAWKWEVKDDDVVACTLSFGCILAYCHAGACICPIDTTKRRKCKPSTFYPSPRAPPRSKRPKKAALETVVLAAVEVLPTTPPATDERRSVSSAPPYRAAEATAASLYIRTLAKNVAELGDDNRETELALMDAIAKKYGLKSAADNNHA